MSNPNIQTRQELSVNPTVDALHVKDASGAVISWIDGTGTPQGNLASAGLNSPVFTGNPQAPTPPDGDSDTSLATTAFVSLKRAVVTITASQIKAMRATPVQLIAAPGSGFALLPLIGFAQNKFGTAAFVGSNGLRVQYHGATTQILQQTSTTFMTQIVNSVCIMVQQNTSTGSTQAQTALENTAIDISQSGASEFTTGDGTLVITLWYFIVSLS